MILTNNFLKCKLVGYELDLINTVNILGVLTLNLNIRLLEFLNYELVTLWIFLIKGDNDP